MKVVTISLDPKVLDPDSPPSARNRLYGEIVDEYHVVVHGPTDKTLKLTDTVTIYQVGGWIRPIRFVRIGLLLRRFIKEGKCDVIVSSDPYFFAALAYYLARWYHVGFEALVLGIEKLTPIRKAVARYFVKRASSVRVNSLRLRQRMVDEFGVPFDDIAFVSLYVPIEKLGLRKAREGTTERQQQDEVDASFRAKFADKFNFVTICRLVVVKNIPMQLKAIAAMKERVPHAHLHIVGDGPDREELESLAAELGVQDVVTFHGHQSGLALGTFYRSADSFMLTSFAEGWPMVVYEALTAGVPVIMTDVGCAGEMIRHNENGLVVPVDDAAALAYEMERMATEDGLRERLRAQANEDVKQYGSRDEILAGCKRSWQKAMDNPL